MGPEYVTGQINSHILELLFRKFCHLIFALVSKFFLICFSLIKHFRNNNKKYSSHLHVLYCIEWLLQKFI